MALWADKPRSGAEPFSCARYLSETRFGQSTGSGAAMSDALPPRIGPPLLHDPAPDFRARTTIGECALSDYRGKWLILFSHPADFTPVCTSEFVSFAKSADRFEALDCALLALSVDSLF